MTKKTIGIAALAVFAAGFATVMAPSEAERAAQALAVMKSSFKDRGQAKVARLDQDDMQKMCSTYVGDRLMPSSVAEGLQKSQQALIKYPADGKLLGDWKEGEKIAQSGAGKQFNDDPERPSGANCYACHELSKAELSYGTIGPSLHNFGKIRGYTPEMQRYAYGKLFNSQAFTPCSSMPRFGHSQILTEKQLKDVTALLMDPDSPVNK